MMTLDDAIQAAVQHHEGQVDQQGQPYILHCLRVMLDVPMRARVVAVLHDTLEDTDIDKGYLVEELGPEELEALELLSRPPADTPDRPTYRDYINRIVAADGAAGFIARQVKLADLRDNLNRMTPALAELEDRYRDAYERLIDGVPA